jgi:hypothetical protein
MGPELGPRTAANEIIPPRPHDPGPGGGPRPDHRSRRQAYTFVVLFAVVLLIGLVAAGVYWRSGSVSANTLADAAALCPVGTTAEPAKVQVSVYNSTVHEGLAKNTATALGKRHFDVVATGNSSVSVSGVATVTYGMYGRAQARSIAMEIKGKVDLADDGRVSTLVDVVLGQKYRGLRDARQATAMIARKPAPAGCVQPDPDGSLSSTTSN